MTYRSNERLAEANAKLLGERQRSKSLLTGSIVNGGLGGTGLDVASLGSVGAYGASLGPLNRSLGLGSSLLGTVGESQSNRVEAYLAKVSEEPAHLRRYQSFHSYTIKTISNLS